MKQSNVRYNKDTKRSERRITLIEQYYTKIKPDMPFSEFQQICETPFKHLRDNMISGEVYEYRYNFFGNFIPRPSSVVWLLTNIKKRYKDQKMTQSDYNKYIGGITRYISRKPGIFQKYAKQIKEFIDIT